MPTAYTAPIYLNEPITFRQFALRCAKRFSSARDEDLNAPLPEEFIPDPEIRTKLTELRWELSQAQKRTDAEWENIATEHNLHAAASHQRAAEKSNALRERYISMLQQVDAWKSPTPDHDGLQAFMKQQLETSLKRVSSQRPLSEYLYTSTQCKADTLQGLVEDIAKYEARWAEACERAKKSNQWVRDLLASLPPDE
jgi:hypothetical protein